MGQAMHRYPQDTEVTVDVAIAALKSQDELIDKAAECDVLWQGLSAAARKAAELAEPDWAVVKTLWLVGDACSMMLDGDSTNAPFEPLAVFADRRSAVLEDFGLDDFALFSVISKSVQNRALRARLADLAWVGAKRKNVEDARRAIDAYVQEYPSEESWVTSLTEWRRAITLCMQLRKEAQGRLEKIEQDLKHIADVALPLEGGLGGAVVRLLFERRLANSEGRKFAELLAAWGESLLVRGSEFWNARTYLGLADQWFTRIGDLQRAADVTVKIALSFEAEADHRIALDPRTGHLVAQSFLADAIQTFRKVPKDQRPSRNVEEQLHRLSRRLTEVGEKAVNSIPTIRSGTTDITEVIERSVRAVRGKEPLQALVELARLHPGANLAKMTHIAEESLRKYPLSGLFGASHISRDGRIIAKTLGGSLNEVSEGHKEKVFGAIMRHYELDINLVCHAQIVPAWSTLGQEHTITRADLAQLMALAPIVPPGRADQFAKGLWEGFEGDFASAIYLLAPQVEHLARWHLKQIGAKTTSLDRDGIENEIGLSSLVEMPELGRVFDENTVFEIRALFCTALGPNLRNEVAHGLLSAEDGRSVPSVYAWWWVLRLTLRSFVHSRLAATQTAVPDPEMETPVAGEGDQPAPASVDGPTEPL